VLTEDGKNRWRWKGLAVRTRLTLTTAIAIALIILSVGATLVLMINTVAYGAAPDDIDWLTTFEVADGVEVAVWTLVDSVSVWPSARSRRDADMIAAGQMQDTPYIFKNKGDYLRIVVYIDDDTCWTPSPEARIVFDYGPNEVEAIEILLLSFDPATGEKVRSMWSSRTGKMIDPASSRYVRSIDGGFRGYLRLTPGSLPRPVRGWFSGGNRWGVERPEAVRVEEGEGVLCERP
jgi:hypothetical protein